MIILLIHRVMNIFNDDMIKPNEFCITFKNVTFSYREKQSFKTSI